LLVHEQTSTSRLEQEPRRPKKYFKVNRPVAMLKERGCKGIPGVDKSGNLNILESDVDKRLSKQGRRTGLGGQKGTVPSGEMWESKGPLRGELMLEGGEGTRRP